VYSSPAVANGVVYVGNEDKRLYAIDAATGKEKWRFATGDRVVASPSVVNGIVYVGSEDKNLYAIGANPVSLTTVPTTIRIIEAGNPPSYATITTTHPIQRTTPPAPIQFALPIAIVFVLGIIIWKRQ